MFYGSVRMLFIPSKKTAMQLCFMIDAGTYFIHSAHLGMILFLLRFFIPICSPIPTPFSSIPQWSFLLCFWWSGNECHFIRCLWPPSICSTYSVFRFRGLSVWKLWSGCHRGGFKHPRFVWGGWVGLGEQGWRVLCVCIMENPQPSFFVVLHLYHLISYIYGFGVHGPRVYSGYKSVQDPLVMLSHPKIFGEQNLFANLKVNN